MMDVIWGAKAKHSYFDELDRINKFHTVREVEKFINLVEEVIFEFKYWCFRRKSIQRYKN